MESIFIFLTSVISSLLTTLGVKKTTNRFKVGSFPNNRKIHVGFVPSMGGIGIFVGSVAGIFISLIWKEYYVDMFSIKYLGIAIGSLVMLSTGIFDDLKGLKPSQKFLMQIIAATIVISFGCKVDVIINPFGDPIELGLFSVPVTYIWLLWVTNSINLLDGLDGLAGGISLIVLSAFGYLSFIQQEWMTFAVCLAMIGGILGFLKYNYHPASIFMGDTGSLFLGFMIAAVALEGLQKTQGNVSLIIPVVALTVPLGDSALAFIRRLYSGHHPFRADKDHLHHRLIALGLSHTQAVHFLLLATLLFAGAAVMLSFEMAEYGFIVLLIVTGSALTGLRRLGYLEAQKSKSYLGDNKVINVYHGLTPLVFKRLWHKVLLIIGDIFAIIISVLITYYIRFFSGLFENAGVVPPNFYFASIATIMLTVFFVLLFGLNDLYRIKWDLSRFDIFQKVSKVLIFGTIIIFVMTLEPDRLLSASRLIILFFAVFSIITVNAFRLLIIYIEKEFNLFEYSLHPTLLVGTSEKAKKILKDIRRNSHLLYDIKGVVTKETKGKTFSDLKNLGSYTDLPVLIKKYKIEEIIIAINERSRDEILNIVAYGENLGVVYKVIPQMYDVISGHKNEEVIGHPLIRIFPDQMLPWQWIFKRIFDLAVAIIGLFILSPFFILVFLLQLYAGIYPFFIIEDKVGKQGKLFGQLLFNVSNKNGRIAQFLFNSNIYKLPQVINLLIGTLSVVGPRPEKLEEVQELRKKIKFYNRRFLIRPGITGWAQVKYRYSESLKQQIERFKNDLFYLENMSLTFDFRIIIRSLWIFFFRK